MKKTYIIPTVEIVETETKASLLTASIPGVTSDPWIPTNPILSPEQELLNLPGIGDQFNFLKLPE